MILNSQIEQLCQFPFTKENFSGHTKSAGYHKSIGSNYVNRVSTKFQNLEI